MYGEYILAVLNPIMQYKVPLRVGVLTHTLHNKQQTITYRDSAFVLLCVNACTRCTRVQERCYVSSSFYSKKVIVTGKKKLELLSTYLTRYGDGYYNNFPGAKSAVNARTPYTNSPG